PATISRIADSEDPETRLMHVEIDLPNPPGKTRKGMIRHGMYGRVTIILDKVEMLSLPSSCLVGRSQDSKGSVYVVRDGRARQVPVQINSDNGVQVTILSGLRADDEVILTPASGIGDGSPVIVSQAEAPVLTSTKP